MRWSAGFGGYALGIGRSRSGTPGSYSSVSSNDDLGSIIWYGDDGSDLNSQAAAINAYVDGTPGANDMPGSLVFSTTADGAASPTERMRITSTGQVRLAGAGITFNGDTATANELDDYEEGTWTPAYDALTTTGSVTHSGTYVKIGRIVYFTATITWVSGTFTSTVNTTRINNLPFLPISAGSGNGGVVGHANLDFKGGAIVRPGISECWLPTLTAFTQSVTTSATYTTNS